MKVVLSRKGFDSGYGGRPSPILPDGRLLSLPIPSSKDERSYGELLCDDGTPVAKVVADLGLFDPKVRCHLDPDLVPWTASRKPGWLPSFGQTDQASSHLRGQKVGVGDLFLFFGWFKQTEMMAMYDAVNGIESVRGRIKRDHALVDPAGAPIYGNRYAAASAAAHAVLTQEHSTLAAIYNAQLDADRAAIEDGPPKADGAAWGASVGDQVVALRQNDGSTPNETQPGGIGPGVFRASWSGVQFRNLVPFAIADPLRYVTAGPPPLTSAEYAAAFTEVKTLGSATIPDPQALEIFQFWASSSGTSQPPGEWIKVAIIVSDQQAKRPSLSKSARLFALTGC